MHMHIRRFAREHELRFSAAVCGHILDICSLWLFVMLAGFLGNNTETYCETMILTFTASVLALILITIPWIIPIARFSRYSTSLIWENVDSHAFHFISLQGHFWILSQNDLKWNGIACAKPLFSEEVSNCSLHRGNYHILIGFSYQKVKMLDVLASLVCLYPM